MKQLIAVMMSLCLALLTACGTSGASRGVGATGAVTAADSALAVAEEAVPEMETERMVLLTSETYGVSMEAPEGYADEVHIDEAYTPRDFFDVDPADFANIAFQLTDSLAAEADCDLVWAIRVTPEEDYQPQDPDLTEVFYYNRQLLGTGNGMAYELLYLGYSTSNLEEPVRDSFLRHVDTGLVMLEDFIARNGLETDGTWRDRYLEHLRILNAMP